MCLAAAILPWVVDLLNSLGYTITIRTSSTDQEEEEAAARACHLRGATSAFATAAPPGAASVVVTSSSSSSSSAAAAQGGRRRGAPRIGMTAASLQMTTIGPSQCQSPSAASDKENDSRQSNNQKKASASDGGESKATSATTGATASDGATSVTGANMVALSTTTTTAVVSPVVDSIGPSPASPSDSNGGGGGGGVARSSSRTCCFCWCCCCSCSCITVQNGEQSSSGPPIMKKKEDSDVPHKVDDLPTQDELKAWGESFDKLMQSTRGREKFREFLRSEYSEENVLFWLACEELKKQTNPESIEERARSIYEDYISILSPKEVSLDSRAREVINKNMVHPSPHTFDDAQFQIYTLMHRDSYPRFLNSNIYKRLLIVQ